MAWSTREVAELAGTSLRAVRHYHEIGLLAEPERLPNGYKQYGVAHLVRLLRIKRLIDLGLTLPGIAALGDADDHPAEALRTLDADLAATVERLQRTRAELALILSRSAPTELPAEIAAAAAGAALTAADRSYLVVMTRVLGPRGLRIWTEVLRARPEHPAATDFDELTEDADDATRQDVAEGMVDYHRRWHAAHPGLRDRALDAPRGPRFVEVISARTIAEVYGPAQRDVLGRLRTLLRESRG